MNTVTAGKKSFLAFFAQFNLASSRERQRQNSRFATLPRADKQILEELNQDNVAYLSDN